MTGSDADLDGDGKPFKGFITMDDDGRNANPDDKDGWYFDPNAGEDFEYKSPLTPYTALGGPEGFDFYSTIIHEVGHALGFRYTANSNIQGRITNNPAPPPEKIFHFLDGSTVYMTTSGGLHLWTGTHPHDLMAEKRRVTKAASNHRSGRGILADSYGYTINWGVIPHRSFVTTFDPTSMKLIVWGDLGTTYEPNRRFDDIKVDVFTGGLIFVDVNGYVKSINQSSVSSIQIEGKESNDQIRIGGTAAGQPIDVFAGNGDNSVFLSHNAKNLDTIQGNVNTRETGGRTTVTLHDENATAGSMFTATGPSVTFQGSNAQIVYDYLDDTRDLNHVTIRGGRHGNTYTLSNPTVRTSFRVDAGLGRDTINIFSTFGGVTVEGGGGLDTVTVGADGRSGLRDILGLVYISNVSPFTNLILDDSGDPNPNPNIQITDTNVTGLGPATIAFDRGELASLTIMTGGGADPITVGSTTTGLANVPRNLRLEDAGGVEQLTIRNSAMVLDFNRTLIGVAIPEEGRLTNFPLSFANFENVKLEAVGGSSSSATLQANPIGVSTVVESFRTVNVGAGNAANIRGNVTISTFVIGNFFIPTELTIDDSAATTAKTIEVGINNVAGVSENNIVFTPGRISTLTVKGGLGGPNHDGFPTGNTVILRNTRFANQTSEYVLNTGAGTAGDNVYIEKSNTRVTVNGQRGLDNVNVGLNGSTEDIDGLLHVTNAGSWSALHIDDSAVTTARNVTLNNPSSFNSSGTIIGLTSFTISYRQRDLRALEITAGSGNNIFTISNTPTSTFAGGLTTTINGTGGDSDTFNINGTKGKLAIDAQGGFNQITVGTSTNGLDRIDGIVDVSGPGGSNHLTVRDTPSSNPHSYIVDDDVVQRIGKAAITYRDLGTVTLNASAGPNPITVRDTHALAVTYVNSGGGDDAMTVERTTGMLQISAGGQTRIDVGTNASSLDNIQYKIVVFPQSNNQMRLSMNDTATTTSRAIDASGTSLGQTYKRTS